MIKDRLNKLYQKLFLSKEQSNHIEGVIIKENNVRIENSIIKVGKNAKVILAENVSIIGYTIVVEQGELTIGANTQLIKGNNFNTPSIVIYSGKLNIANHCIIKSDFVIRFGGICSIGEYTGIMESTEIRVDESISIGSFNLISYECMIYDTNTHCMYKPEVRRQMTIKDFPAIGSENEKPKTKPVVIGNDCWLGKRSVVFKGSNIGNHCIIAACAVITKSIDSDSIAYGNPAISRLK